MSDSHTVEPRGSTLMEVLVALSLAAILLTMTTPSLQATSHLAKLAATQEQFFQQRSFVQDTVMRAVSRSRILRGIRLWQSSHSWTKTLRNLPREHQPAPDSSILSVIELDRSVIFSTIDSREGALRGCVVADTSLSLKNDYWLGISLAGAVTFRSQAEGFSDPQCQAQLHPQAHNRELFPPYQAQMAEHVLVAYPISDVFALYKDTHGTFRLVSYLTTESQPLAYGLSEFVITDHAGFARLLVTLDGDLPRVTMLPAAAPGSFDYLELVL